MQITNLMHQIHIAFIQVIYRRWKLRDLVYSFHPWLADLAAPVGSQEVVDHTHKWWQLIGQHVPVCRLGPQVSAGWIPSW